MEFKNRYSELFAVVFRSVATDNGSEFSKLSTILESLKSEAYFTHLYLLWERASNKKQNWIIRRFILKGKAMRKITLLKAKEIERWMNEYLRKILDYKTTQKCFYEELFRISADIKVVEELVIGCHNCASQCS